MINKLYIIAFILLITSFLNLAADDGSWSKTFTIDGGNIYSESDNTDIELVKEILIFTGEYTKAVFQFKNRSEKAVTVSCGFPVQYKIDGFFGGDSLEVKPPSRYAKVKKIPAVDYFETLSGEYTGPPEYLDGITTDIILNNSYNNSRGFISPKQTPEDLIFNITKDGKLVKIDKVLLERYIGEEGAKVTFHYKHNLNFKPGELSTVVVEYYQNLLHGGDGMSSDFQWNYIIGTGSTWKGSIGKFILIKPSDWTGDIEGMDVIKKDTQLTILSTKNYEPSRKLIYTLYSGGYGKAMDQYEYLENTLPKLKNMWADNPKSLIQPSSGVQKFVTNISASSSLPDKLPVFTNNGVIEKANFSPVAAFDGLTETSWCENAKGDGIGEFIELTLKKDAWGLSINNGFTRFPAKDWLFDKVSGKIPFEDKMRDDSNGIKDYFTQNNRVKKLAISNATGETLYNIDLEDQRDSQTFPGIMLPAGTYRFIIKEVYPGTKWQDTCLGEITFLESESNQQMKAITDDQFYVEALQGISFK